MTGTTPWQAQANVEPIAAVTIGAIANSALFNTISGCASTYSAANMQVTVASGSITHNGTATAVAGNTVTLVSDPTNPRWTYRYINSSGVAAIVSGSPAATPAVPDPGANPTNGLDYVQAALTIADSATYKLDKRIMAWPGVIYGFSTTEATATSGSASDYVTISNLSIPAGKPFRVKFMFRKTAGSASAAGFGIKINSTVVVEATAAVGYPHTSTSNVVQQGIAWFDVFPGETSYLSMITWYYQCFNTNGPPTTEASTTADAVLGTANGNLTNAIPAATVTSIAIRGIGNAAMTTAVKNVYVEAI